MYRLTSEHAPIVATARAVASTHLAPRAADVDAEGLFPAHAVRALGEARLLGLTIPAAARMAVRQLVLEYATERAGELVRVDDKELGLGVVNPRTDEVESVALIRQRVERALTCYPPERIFLNPDCGFGTFSRRPVNTPETAAAKLRAMVEAARTLRG